MKKHQRGEMCADCGDPEPLLLRLTRTGIFKRIGIELIDGGCYNVGVYLENIPVLCRRCRYGNGGFLIAY